MEMLPTKLILIATTILLACCIQDTLQECSLTKNLMDGDVLKCSASRLYEVTQYCDRHRSQLDSHQIQELHFDGVVIGNTTNSNHRDRKDLNTIISSLLTEHPISILSWIKSNLTDEQIQYLLNNNDNSNDKATSSASGTTQYSTVTTRKYSKLRELDLSKNQIVELRKTYFRTINNLKTLRVSSNLITTLHAETFSELADLRELYLNGNQLRNLSLKLFAHLPTLIKLDLSNASLIDLPRSVFEGLISLKELHLASNLLYVLPFQVFREMKVSHMIFCKSTLTNFISTFY